jgi:hypothetical protein
MHAPEKVHAATLADYCEVLSQAMFQAGLPWSVVAAKWPGIRDALAGFDPDHLARLTDDDVTAMLRDTRLIRHPGKLRAVIHNAARLLELDAGPGGFRRWLRSHGDYPTTVRALRSNFRFIGETSAYYFLWVVDEPVPDFTVWAAGRGWKSRAAT